MKKRFYSTRGLLLLIIAAFSPQLFAQVGAIDAAARRAAFEAVRWDVENSNDVLREANLALWQAAQTGTAADVPEIAPLLKLEQLNAAALVALKNIPGSEALDALRAALNQCDGDNLIGVVQTLGDLGDVESLERIAALADENDAKLAAAALDAAAKIGGVQARELVFAQLAAIDVKIRDAAADAALRFVERELESENVEAANELLATLDVAKLSDAKKAIVAKAKERAAGFVYPPSTRPVDEMEFGTSAELAELLTDWSNDVDASKKAELAEKAFRWCRRSTPGSEYEIVIGKRLSETVDSASQEFLQELLVQVGTKQALATLVAALSDSQDSTADNVTKILGQWITADAKPVLAELLEKNVVPKFGERVFRGYLRIVRQMYDVPGPKLVALKEIEPFVKTPAVAALFAQTFDDIQASRRDRPLFNGETFDGWEGNFEFFQIASGEIVAGCVDKPIPRNEFLCTTSRFRDFELTLECKIEGSGANAGVQFRSERIPNHHEMVGFQADMSEDGLYWGSLYDESRRNQFLARPTAELLQKIYKPGDWNEYKIVCWGRRVKIYLNGTLTVDYVETDESIPLDGVIGLQIHQGGPSRAFYRNVRLEQFESRRIR